MTAFLNENKRIAKMQAFQNMFVGFILYQYGFLEHIKWLGPVVRTSQRDRYLSEGQQFQALVRSRCRKVLQQAAQYSWEEKRFLSRDIEGKFASSLIGDHPTQSGPIYHSQKRGHSSSKEKGQMWIRRESHDGLDESRIHITKDTRLTPFILNF